MNQKKTELERVNYHTHCDRCRHARGAAREYAQEALEKGLTRLGFSDHMPYPDGRAGLRMPYAELEDYLDDIQSIKDELYGRLDILCGFEIEYSKEYHSYYESMLAKEKCEYLLLGQHFYESKTGEQVNVYQLDSTEQYEEYAAIVVEAMKTGYFRYLAHPDLIFINDFPWDVHCERACDILIDSAAKYGFALEYNANGIRRTKQRFSDGERYPYPHDKFWNKVKGTGIDVYVGSDCHNPSQVYDDAVVMSYQTLMEMGIVPKTDF